MKLHEMKNLTLKRSGMAARATPEASATVAGLRRPAVRASRIAGNRSGGNQMLLRL